MKCIPVYFIYSGTCILHLLGSAVHFSVLKNKSHVHNLGSQKGPSDLYFQFGSFFGQFNKGDLATVYLGFAS